MTTSTAYAQQSARLEYALGFRGMLYPGETIVLQHNFSNTGQFQVRVTGIVVSLDFWLNGTRPVISDLPLDLFPGERKRIDMPVVVPLNASIGIHPIRSDVYWSYYTTGWSGASPIIVEGSITVSLRLSPETNPGTNLISLLPTIAPIVIGVYLALVAAALVLLVRERQKRSQNVIRM